MSYDWKALAAPFPGDQIEWRMQQAGEKNGRVWCLVVPYITNRGIMNRLDDVVGPESWKNEYRPGPAGGVICGLSIRVDGEWITKWDGAENTDIESVRGGLSDAMKRAAVHWGISRYLYGLSEAFAEITDNGTHRGKTKEGRAFRWNPPDLPAWALPGRLSAEEREHTAMIVYLTTNGGNAPPDLQDRIRQEWKQAKSDPVAAATLVGLVEEAGGPKFNVSQG